MKNVTIPLTVQGVARLERTLGEYRQRLADRARVLLNRLADEGYHIAAARFARAEYDGTNDVSVSVKPTGENARAVVAVGAAVLFIEFGTGVTYPDVHPEAAEHSMKRGEYGDGHGKRPYWGYYGDPGTNGVLKQKKSGDAVVITRGNPANMAMYETVKELEDRLGALAWEVFT